MRAGFGTAFQKARAHALARHFKQAETADAPDLNARAVYFQRFFQALFDGAVVAPFIHVDKVNNQQTGQIAQARLARNFRRGFQIGGKGGFLHRIFACRFAGVYIDCHQRFGLVNHQIAARWQRHHRIEHGGQLVLNGCLAEQRIGVGVLFNFSRMTGHQQFHITARQLVAIGPADHNLFKILAVNIADAPLDEAAFFVNQGGRGAANGNLAHIFPKPPQILPVAPDFGQRALRASGADNQTHAVRHI